MPVCTLAVQLVNKMQKLRRSFSQLHNQIYAI